jgi:uncharacterized protein (DUF433 family)
MIATPVAMDVPLRTDEHGTIRVGGTRVTLESVIADFHRSATPEEIVHDFPVLKVADVYLVIGYYLANRTDVDAYIQRQHEESERLRREWEADHPNKLTRADLLARLESKRKQNGEP